MDNRLERIRLYKGNVMDFTSYINDRIKETQSENTKNDRKESLKKKMKKLNESIKHYEVGNFIPNGKLTSDCIQFILSCTDDFDERYAKAETQMYKNRWPLRRVDYNLANEIFSNAIEWLDSENIYYNENEIIESIEEIFG